MPCNQQVTKAPMLKFVGDAAQAGYLYWLQGLENAALDLCDVVGGSRLLRGGGCAATAAALLLVVRAVAAAAAAAAAFLDWVAFTACLRKSPAFIHKPVTPVHLWLPSKLSRSGTTSAFQKHLFC